MRPDLRHILLVLLASSVLGAQIVCGCPLVAKGQPEVARAARDCTGSRPCCKKNLAAAQAPAQSRGDQPCEKCNLKHRTQITPDRSDASQSVDPAFAASPLPFNLPVDVVDGPATRAVGGRVLIPPIPSDLFHAHALLLI